MRAQCGIQLSRTEACFNKTSPSAIGDHTLKPVIAGYFLQGNIIFQEQALMRDSHHDSFRQISKALEIFDGIIFNAPAGSGLCKEK